MATQFQYCPLCGNKLNFGMKFGQVRPFCARCHFVQFRDPKVAVIGLIHRENEVLLIRRGVDPGRGLWALPGGYMDAHEMPKQALAREIAEEVGLAINVGSLLEIYPMKNEQAESIGIVLAFEARLQNEHDQPVIGDDAAEAAWFGSANLPSKLAFESTQHLLQTWLDREDP